MKVKYKIMNMGQAMNAFGITVEDLRDASGLKADMIEDIIADKITVSHEVAFILQKIFRGNITVLQCIGGEEDSDTVSEAKVAKETAEEVAQRKFNEVKSVFEKEIAELLKLKEESGERFAAAVREIEKEFQENKIREEQARAEADKNKVDENTACKSKIINKFVRDLKQLESERVAEMTVAIYNKLPIAILEGIQKNYKKKSVQLHVNMIQELSKV